MPDLIRIALAFALLFSSGAQAEEVVQGKVPRRQPAEICEAFSWGVPVEQSFTPESVLRWRQQARSGSLQMESTPSPTASATHAVRYNAP
jgi:hypothetical protein